MELYPTGALDDKISIFAVGKKTRKEYINLREIAVDLISGLIFLAEKPNKVLLYQGTHEIREYIAQLISEEGYRVLNRQGIMVRHPKMRMYTIQLDYFLERTINKEVPLESFPEISAIPATA